MRRAVSVLENVRLSYLLQLFREEENKGERSAHCAEPLKVKGKKRLEREAKILLSYKSTPLFSHSVSLYDRELDMGYHVLRNLRAGLWYSRKWKCDEVFKTLKCMRS